MKSISFFFPCYNDAQTIGSLVILAHKNLAKVTQDFEVIVVNDCSEDNSLDILQALQKVYPETLRIIHHQKNRGYGGAIISGFTHATKEWVGYTDGDAQYDLDELSRFFSCMNDQVDWIQGFKGWRMDPLHRIIIGDIYRLGMKFLFRLKIRDVDCDFRFVRRDFIENLHLKSQSGCITIEMVKKLELLGARVAEVQVSHYFRLAGKSQFFNFRRIFKTIIGLCKLWKELMPHSFQTKIRRDHQRIQIRQKSFESYQGKINRVNEEVQQILHE